MSRESWFSNIGSTKNDETIPFLKATLKKRQHVFFIDWHAKNSSEENLANSQWQGGDNSHLTRVIVLWAPLVSFYEEIMWSPFNGLFTVYSLARPLQKYFRIPLLHNPNQGMKERHQHSAPRSCLNFSGTGKKIGIFQNTFFKCENHWTNTIKKID